MRASQVLTMAFGTALVAIRLPSWAVGTALSAMRAPGVHGSSTFLKVRTSGIAAAASALIVSAAAAAKAAGRVAAILSSVSTNKASEASVAAERIIGPATVAVRSPAATSTTLEDIVLSGDATLAVHTASAAVHNCPTSVGRVLAGAAIVTRFVVAIGGTSASASHNNGLLGAILPHKAATATAAAHVLVQEGVPGAAVLANNHVQHLTLLQLGHRPRGRAGAAVVAKGALAVQIAVAAVGTLGGDHVEASGRDAHALHTSADTEQQLVDVLVAAVRLATVAQGWADVALGATRGQGDGGSIVDLIGGQGLNHEVALAALRRAG